jgi:regulator of telomere elongation helicase 1
VPTIYYSSRTHSQLSQCILEIKNTAYKPLAVTLGSRDQMCIDSVVSSLPTGAKTAACKALTAKGKCSAGTGSESINLLKSRSYAQAFKQTRDYGY